MQQLHYKTLIKLLLLENIELMYSAIIGTITVKEHPNADRLALGEISGFQVVVSKDTVDGQIGIFFPSDGCLSDAYCSANSLWPIFEEGVRVGGGFIDPKNNRVRAQNFRGEISEGLFMPLTSLKGLISDKAIESLTLGTTFTELDGIKICGKWINPQTRKYMQGLNKVKTNRKETPWLTMWQDTAQLKYKISDLKTGDKIILTEKIHGTCLTYNTRVRMWDNSVKSLNKITIGDVVIGHDSEQGFSPSTVLDVMKYSPADSKWLKIYTSKPDAARYSWNILNCTKEHRVWTSNRGWVEAQYLTKEDELVSSVRYPIINYEGQQILIGKALGDGSIDRHNTTWAVSYSHSEKQESYLQYCHYVLGDFSTDSIHTAESGYGSLMYRARTKQTYQINELFSSWFDESSGKKEIPGNFELSPISLAFWYMDDGSLTHHDKQKDRACFAVCGYSEQSVINLVNAFAKLDILAVSYKDAENYWRIRLNTKDAYKMFELIKCYIPLSMRYKLPAELREYSYIDLSDIVRTEFKYYPVPFSIEKIEEDIEQHYRYDITTSTSNFIANNVVVHNSGRSGYSWEEKVSPIWSWAERFRNTPVLKNALFFKHYDYKWMNGTRRVLVDSFKNANGGYYSNADFRYKHEETLSKVLPPGFQAYYEVVGYTGTDSTIMGVADNAKHSKEFVKTWGKSTTFKYGCANGESRMYIYALSVTLPDGFKQWLTWDEMKYLCNLWGLQTVPYIEEFIYDGNSEALLAKCDALSKGASTLDESHIREGICLMIPSKLKLQVFKVKSRDFYILEDVVKSDESVIDVEEAESY